MIKCAKRFLSLHPNSVVPDGNASCDPNDQRGCPVNLAFQSGLIPDTTGGGIAYKHPQVVEFVPFFVRADYQTEAGLKQLCRVPHYLRTSPAWVQGNILYPYPYYLAHTLVDDKLYILGMD